MGRRAFGSVRKKTSGKWEARFRDRRGQVHYRYFTTKKEAQAHLSATEADILRGDWLNPRLGSITFDEWAERFMTSKRNIRPTTESLYRYMIRLHISPTFGSWQLVHITPDAVEDWMTELRNNPRLSPSSEVKALRLMRQMMSKAQKERRILHNPCDHVETPRHRAEEMMFLSERQVGDLATAIGERFQPWRAMVALASYGGLRWGECAGLPISNVHPLHSRLRVTQQLHRDGRIDEPKSRKSVRDVTLPRWLSDELAAAIALRTPSDELPEQHSDLVFLTRTGMSLAHAPSWRRNIWKPSVHEALPEELHGLRFHDLWHTAVAIAIDSARRAGEPLNPKALQDRMGHSTITMTFDRYGHLMDGHDDRMVEAMGNPFAQQEPELPAMRLA